MARGGGWVGGMWKEAKRNREEGPRALGPAFCLTSDQEIGPCAWCLHLSAKEAEIHAGSSQCEVGVQGE